MRLTSALSAGVKSRAGPRAGIDSPACARAQVPAHPAAARVVVVRRPNGFARERAPAHGVGRDLLMAGQPGEVGEGLSGADPRQRERQLVLLRVLFVPALLSLGDR